MVNQKLIEFIIEARKRGFDDWQIREPLLKNGWPESEVDAAFKQIYGGKDGKYKEAVTIHLKPEIMKKIEKRAKRNLLGVHEQIEDIVRRSCVGVKKTAAEEKVDDKFITFFSRKKR